ncbi:alpha/beta hydrolase [Roseococcus sp. DSY-14]|uniref:alpha/beta hydrolase n=1 Tax=Roseococcus sp. DSY-14 TaxID=3369650 RepID=UPI00387AE88A
MPNDPRLDPEMAAFTAMMEARAQPIALPAAPRAAPFEPLRRLNDGPQEALAEGGPLMAESRDLWWPIRGRRTLVRLHRPVAGGALPVLLYLHGGGWVWGSIDTHDRLMRAYAAAAGCAVLGLDYALSPEAVFPQALEECAAALRFAAARGAEWGLDGARIVLGGDSAGANLAAATALLNAEAADPVPLRGLLLNYGVFDHDLDTPSYREFAAGYGLTRDKMRFYWDAYCPDPLARLSPLASPLRGDLSVLPPTLLHVAELDVLASENHAFAEKLRQAGVKLELEVFPGTVHGFLRAQGRVGATDRATAAAASWLGARLA